jgi:hypothetical protein
MRLDWSHQELDVRNAEEDRAVARQLRRHPRILKQARLNLARWIARDGKRIRPVFEEWRRILSYLNAREIADFLTSDTPRARRLRQSSPFIGLTTRAATRHTRRKRK